MTVHIVHCINRYGFFLSFLILILLQRSFAQMALPGPNTVSWSLYVKSYLFYLDGFEMYIGIPALFLNEQNIY